MRPGRALLIGTALVAAYLVDFFQSARGWLFLVRRAARDREWAGFRFLVAHPLLVMAFVGLARAGYLPSLALIYDPATPRAAAERRLEHLGETIRRRSREARAAMEAAAAEEPTRC
jgi:hypothetical protein